ncbi:hypothetical protein C8R44DRAFT_348977 [Mycena epipterygia]|nr:hypothetical protein C8R44DRAFT_348977 [Mycena epipterygia]
MFARYEYYQNKFCAGSPNQCGWFSTWLELPSITVKMQMWAMFASFIVSFLSVGWWSELGDCNGRKIVLFCSILGAMLIDLIYLVVAGMASEDVQDSLSLGLIIEGLLGGFATYNGVAHAYAFDVATTPLSRLVLFGALNALSMTGFIIGAVIGNFTRNNVSYILSIVFALLNLAFIYAVLPESLKPREDARPAAPQRSVVRSIVAPFTVFFRGSGNHLLLFAFAFYIYSLTSAHDTALLKFTATSPYLPSLPRAVLLIAPRVMNLATLLCILPALAWVWRRAYGDTERSALRLASSLSQNALLLATVSSIGVLVFTVSPHAHFLYALFTVLHPFTVAAGPALYALGAAYFVALGRQVEIGTLFGALALWGQLAQFESYAMYSGGGGQLFVLSSFFLVIALGLLVPDPAAMAEPEVSTDENSGDSGV